MSIDAALADADALAGAIAFDEDAAIDDSSVFFESLHATTLTAIKPKHPNMSLFMKAISRSRVLRTTTRERYARNFSWGSASVASSPDQKTRSWTSLSIPKNRNRNQPDF
jgi:hypothetical protein